MSAVYREARSLALISNSQALAEYYGQAILRRLETEFPSAILRRFFPADTDVIVQAFNKVVARIPLEEARAAPSPQQSMEVWVVHDAAALLVYRAAWPRDSGTARTTREAAMAKLFATEAAQRVVDGAVQLFGGQGVISGNVVERLYREVRALRIYEGASEVQKLVIARQIMSR